jgi:C-terminal processing protease CtpA/Prc
MIGSLTDTQHGLVWGRTPDGIGDLNVSALEDKELPTTFDAALESLADTFGLVVDLRFNGGGDETLAQSLAGRFLHEERVYSTNQYRTGPRHDDFGEVLQRKCGPRGPWRYESPVVVLWGQRTMSSAGDRRGPATARSRPQPMRA